VQPTNRVRDRLNKITAEFDDVGADAAATVFGSHRRPQAVLLSWEEFLRLQGESHAAAADSSP
jgi:hypothetical protein